MLKYLFGVLLSKNSEDRTCEGLEVSAETPKIRGLMLMHK